MALASTSESFTWRFRHQIDGKGRLTIPARWRFDGLREFHCGPHRRSENLGQYQPVLVLLTEQERKSRIEEIDSRDDFPRPKRKAFIAKLNGSLAPCPMDSNNRILIPLEVLEKYQVGSDVVLRGAETYVEVWRAADYDAAESAQEQDDLDAQMGLEGW